MSNIETETITLCGKFQVDGVTIFNDKQYYRLHYLNSENLFEYYLIDKTFFEKEPPCYLYMIADCNVGKSTSILSRNILSNVVWREI